jgi:hypothetical protein
VNPSRFRERVLVHQVHPVKVGADATTAVVSYVLLWRGRPRAAALVQVVLPVAGSAVVLARADLDALAGTRRGRYVLAHMPTAAQAIRLAANFVMVARARRHSWALLAAGRLVVLAGWSHGMLPGARRT